MKVVLDTNVIVSGLNFPGNERHVLDLARSGRFRLYLSSIVLQETEGVLVRKFRWDGHNVARAIQTLRGLATLVEPQLRPPVIEGNAADNRILECAVDVSADYLVTPNYP